MLEVLLVDDEPFILQGLQLLIDWEKEGYHITTASNGGEALEIIKERPVDLIIADIKMPVMTGLELLKALRSDLKSDTYFVILSGFAEFSYAQEALRYDCTDYILKPVEKDQLMEILSKVSALNSEKTHHRQDVLKKEKAYMERVLMRLLSGKYDVNDIEYISDKTSMDDEKCYVEIQLDDLMVTDETLDEDKKAQLAKVYSAALDYLKDDAIFCIRDISDSEQVFDIGFIYSESMGKRLQMTSKEYLNDFLDYLIANTNLPLTMLIGKNVSGIRNISKSYGTANMLHSLQGFREKKNIYFYEEEYKVGETGLIICKKELDALIAAIERGEHVEIRKCVDDFYEEMQKTGVTGSTMNLNINYLLFQLIHLASELDSEVNQEEILRIISESTSEEGISRGGKTHLCRMAYAYGEYISQLRKNVSRGVLGDVEEEIKKNYASNLTLKDLSEKYFVNSAYLGQLFRKKYGCSFKDYLNKKRIEEAARLLRKTDMKIYEVAEAVGYKDSDYFVNKFIEAMGCTPTKYKKNI
ncbi:response regulator transcription factor [Pseudobutyrivibrio xylanivorans]|uniref:Stage 0 sporulation protein A homolog n=1 Tax=Pseudobutyrivibrio xylanivorans TaxID=185007 RepID=A0A5P6VR51_PSEXY|nr:response regulator [Pseudobutyrivibrio xylanivorans]QFJ55153.1 response regulator [Pseudobutyrivibrio xylanivorans]